LPPAEIPSAKSLRAVSKTKASGSPNAASAPDRGVMKPILMVSLDCAQPTRPVTASAPAPVTAAVTNLRRETVPRTVGRLAHCVALSGLLSAFVM
jgi:hypothetical protein